MPLPEPTGPHAVGVVEIDIAAPSLESRVVPAVVYYPAAPRAEAPAVGCFGAAAEERLPWLDAR
eukprot:CAMPEP_0119291192 /NCGR_PEP_ID=MMETSP1329-20130426/42049_1 /TAXON_ID=114041 /ORGANISM="Genus nov. species nov., Strain RCC1024" /LENGTH=63 /DNA_ID=CAMNT_0007292019 /DNA_START=360 /DNA_END=548 /DNA_ORIENTATION=+